MSRIANTLLHPLAKARRGTFKLIKGDAGAEDRELLNHIESCYHEATSFREGTEKSSAALSIVDDWEIAGQHFVGNQWAEVRRQGLEKGYEVYYGYSTAGTDNVRKVVLNLTLNAILSNVETQTSEPPMIDWQPVEMGDRPMYLLSKEAGDMLMGQIRRLREVADQEIAELMAAAEGAEPDEQQVINDQIEQVRREMDAMVAQRMPVQLEDAQMVHPSDPTAGPDVPLTDQQVGQINEMISNQLLREDDLIEINDKAVTEVMQNTWDHLYDMADGEQRFTMNEILCNTYGNAVMGLQWHHEGPKAHTFTLTNENIISVWIDATHETLDDADYLGVDRIMHKDRAKALYPELDDDLIEGAEGFLGRNKTLLPHIFSQDFRRAGMLMIRTTYLRHKLVPMTPHEAVEAGLVDEVRVTRDGEVDIDPDTGQPRKQYTLAGKALEQGELEGTVEVEPQINASHGTRWPDTYGVMQVSQLQSQKQQVLQKIRCPYQDIPYAWNVNIPRPDGSPYGMGEVKRLADISKLINEALTNISSHVRRFQTPQVFMPASIFKRLRAMGMEDFFRRASGITPLPDNDYNKMIQAGGVRNMIAEVPPLAQGAVNYLVTLIQQHDVLSGNAPVRQGRAPFAGAAAKTIEALQAAGEGPVAMRAKWTEYALERTARTGMDAAVKWMPEKRWMMINSGYTLSAMREILRRLENSRFNVRASVVSGRGTAKQQRVAEALTLREAGLLSRKTTMAKTGVENPSRENEAIIAEQREMAMPSAPAT